jgi:hypothetical protein
MYLNLTIIEISVMPTYLLGKPYPPLPQHKRAA